MKTTRLAGRSGTEMAGLPGQVDGLRSAPLAIDHVDRLQGFERVFFRAIRLKAELPGVPHSGSTVIWLPPGRRSTNSRVLARASSSKVPSSCRKPMLRLLSTTSTACTGCPSPATLPEAEKYGRARARPNSTHAGGAQQEQEQVANLQNAAAMLHGLAEKVHGRPMNGAKAAAIEQMDNDGTSGSSQAGNSEHPVEERRHWLKPRWRRWKTESGKTRMTKIEIRMNDQITKVRISIIWI